MTEPLKPIRKPIFIVSFDFESLWGLVFERRSDIDNFLRYHPDDYDQTVEKILSLLKKHQISATWGTVGALFHEDPEDLPLGDRYTKIESTYCVGDRSKFHEHFFKKHLVEKLLELSPRQELAYHSTEHKVYQGLTEEEAYRDLEYSKVVGDRFGVEFKSFIFPQDKAKYTGLLKQLGYRIYRGAQTYLEGGFARKVVGRFLPIPISPRNMDGIWEIPTNFYYADDQYPWSLKPRTHLAIYLTRLNRTVLHVNVHPWNIMFRDSILDDMSSLFSHITRIRKKGKIQVSTMGELADMLDNSNETRAYMDT
jgi:peptidoglycan/xylan/chitin deacetylase (PgdA/CDA1 family)